MPSVKSKNTVTKNVNKQRTVHRYPRSSSPSSSSSEEYNDDENQPTVIGPSKQKSTNKSRKSSTSITRTKTTTTTVPPTTFNLLSPIPSTTTNGTDNLTTTMGRRQRGGEKPRPTTTTTSLLATNISPIIPSSPDLLTFSSSNNNNPSTMLSTQLPILSSSASTVSSATLTTLQEKMMTMQTAFESLSTSTFSSQLKWKEHEQALKQQLHAQQLLINELRNENQSLRKHMDNSTNDSTSSLLPIKGILQSVPYQTLYNEKNQLTTQITKQDITIQELLARPTYPVGTLSILELFRTLTGLKITPRSPSSLSTVDGVYDIETNDPESGQLITFILDIFRVEKHNPTMGDENNNVEDMYPTGIAIEYTPGLGTEYLPEFLQSVITFGSDQAPMFLSKITEKLRRMDDDEAKEEIILPETTEGNEKNVQPIATCLDSTLEAVATVPTTTTTITASLMGTTIEIDSMTPHAVRRGRNLPAFTSPGPTVIMNGLPPVVPTSNVKGSSTTTMMMTKPTPSITPLAHARGIKAPFGTPAPSFLQYTEENEKNNYDMVQSSSITTTTTGRPKDDDLALMMVETDDANTATTITNPRTTRGRSISVDRYQSSSSSSTAAASSSSSTMNNCIPATVNPSNRRSARVIASTTSRAQSVRSHRGRRSIGHVVTAEGFLHDASPASKMGLRSKVVPLTKENNEEKTTMEE